MLCRDWQRQKALAPMKLQVSGMETFVRLMQPSNASLPM